MSSIDQLIDAAEGAGFTQHACAHGTDEHVSLQRRLPGRYSSTDPIWVVHVNMAAVRPCLHWFEYTGPKDGDVRSKGRFGSIVKAVHWVKEHAA
jgi:hypothetical protein